MWLHSFPSLKFSRYYLEIIILLICFDLGFVSFNVLFYISCSIGKTSFHKTINEIKLNITTNTSHTLHCLLECPISTEQQNGWIVVRVAWTEWTVNMVSYHLVKGYTKTVVCGASSSYCETVRIRPIYMGKYWILCSACYCHSIMLQIPFKL